MVQLMMADDGVGVSWNAGQALIQVCVRISNIFSSGSDNIRLFQILTLYSRLQKWWESRLRCGLGGAPLAPTLKISGKSRKIAHSSQQRLQYPRYSWCWVFSTLVFKPDLLLLLDMVLMFSDEAKSRITAMIECDMKNGDTQSEIKVSNAQLYRYRSNLRTFGRIDPPPLKKQGRERLLTEEEEEVRHTILNAKVLVYTVCAGLAWFHRWESYCFSRWDGCFLVRRVRYRRFSIHHLSELETLKANEQEHCTHCFWTARRPQNKVDD